MTVDRMASSPHSGARPSAIGEKASIFQRLREQSPLLYLDYDGTLAPISPRPEQARMSEAMRETVAALVNLCTVAVISGRALADIREHVGLDNIHYAGNHGLEIEGPQLSHQDEAALASRRSLDRAYESISRGTAGLDGVLIEHKGLSLSVHYRLTPESQQEVVARTVRAAVAAEPGLRINPGKCQFELRPVSECNKGTAVRLLRSTLDPHSHLLPIYIGDDRTDEDAFEALRDDGITVLVTEDPRPTAAHYSLPKPDDVHAFLDELRGFLIEQN